jgi:hypothetical protein
MNLRRLRKELPTAQIIRDGKKVTLSCSGLTYTVEEKRGKDRDMEEYLKSKIPGGFMKR